MKKKFLIAMLLMRLVTNDGVFLNVRRPIPKNQPGEVRIFIRRPCKKGRKKSHLSKIK